MARRVSFVARWPRAFLQSKIHVVDRDSKKSPSGLWNAHAVNGAASGRWIAGVLAFCVEWASISNDELMAKNFGFVDIVVLC